MIYLEQLLQATSGQLFSTGKQQVFEAFNHDTRQLLTGKMYVAVRGVRTDGHAYLIEAVEEGATGLLIEESFLKACEEKLKQQLTNAGVTIIVVADTRLALQQYAGYILRLWQPMVIAVTGSTGKTSTKEAIASLLSTGFATFKSWQNYNDLLGLPLSLGRLEPRHEYAVLELACDHPGEIAQLCKILQPKIGVLTNISPVQLHYFGSVEHLARELSSLVTSLPADGFAVINQDDELTRTLAMEVQAQDVLFVPSHARDRCFERDGTSFVLPTQHGDLHFSSHLLGPRHISTILAAYTVGKICSMGDERILHALSQLQPFPGRLNPLPGVEDSLILDDTHNAAPAAVTAGLETLRALPGRRKIAILGDMLNLGEYSETAYHQVGIEAAGSLDYLVTRGEGAALIAESAQQAGLSPERIIRTSSHEDAASIARQILQIEPPTDEPDLVLVKGSEDTRMERVTERLLADPERDREMLVRQTPGWKQIVVMQTERPTWLEIDLGAIGKNTREIKKIVGPDVQILAALKADGYGHGALKVGRTVLNNGASMLGVATISEGKPLREAGITAPILIFGYVPLWQMREAVRLNMTVTVYAMESARALARAAEALSHKTKVHVKIDSGMGRLGVRTEALNEIIALIREVKDQPWLELEGIFTHFAKADSQDKNHAYTQLERFQTVLAELDRLELRPPLTHAANSAAMLNLPEAHFQMVRPGIALYGLNPSSEVQLPPGFRPALSFKTQVAQVKMLPTGECISYGCIYTTTRPTRIAVIPVGYADGFRRGPSNWGTVLVHGQEAPILGRVCMDQCMIDVSEIPEVRMGDEVVLIGDQGEASLSAEMVAERLGTISYEVVSEILARVPRVD